MEMNKLILTLLSAFALSACSNSNQENNDSKTAVQEVQTPAENTGSNSSEKKTEYYVVGTDVNMPPFISKDEKGTIVGFDIDILRAVAEDQNFSFDLVADKKINLFDELANGKYQILVANLGISPERLQKSEMSKPYVWAPNVIMGKKTSTAKTLADLVSDNSKVSVQNSSFTHQQLIKENVKNIETTDNLYQAYVMLMRGEVDYVLGDAGALNSFHQGNTDTNKPDVYTAVYDKNEDVSVGFAVQKGNKVLIDKINTGLDNIRKNGNYDKIYQKWFGDDQSLKVPESKLQ